MVRVRFAPSPTGTLHIGGARTALFNYLVARNAGGKFILRIDDTDRERSLPEHEVDILSGLNWLGLFWDEGPEVGGDFGPYRQSERAQKHIAAAQYLLDKNHAYRDDEGVVRMRYPNDEIVVEDDVCGRCVFHPQSLGPEVVILRSDGTPTYHLATVSDDIDMGITHIIRGQDHLTNTAKHLAMFQYLGHAGPSFAHLPLILGEDGSKLSKRNSTGMTTVSEFRQAGYLPEALKNFLLLLGWSHPEAKEQLTLEEAITSFSVERVGKTASVFEPNKLDFLNGWWLRHVSSERLWELVQPFCADYQAQLDLRAESDTHAVTEFLRAEVNSLAEIPALLALLFNVELPWSDAATERLKDAGFSEAVRSVILAWSDLVQNTPLESGSDRYSSEEFSKLQGVLKKQVAVEKKYVFQGLRLALMGNTSGPELNSFVPLVARDIILQRAKDALSRISA